MFRYLLTYTALFSIPRTRSTTNAPPRVPLPPFTGSEPSPPFHLKPQKKTSLRCAHGRTVTITLQPHKRNAGYRATLSPAQHRTSRRFGKIHDDSHPLGTSGPQPFRDVSRFNDRS
jgi:hypothetical protein